MPVNISIQYEQEDNNKHVTSKHKSMNFMMSLVSFVSKCLIDIIIIFVLQPRKKVVIFIVVIFCFIQR